MIKILKITYLYSTWTRLTGGTITNRCFCYIRGNIRGEYEFTVLLLLWLLNVFPQNKIGKRVMWNIREVGH